MKLFKKTGSCCTGSGSGPVHGGLRQGKQRKFHQAVRAGSDG